MGVLNNIFNGNFLDVLGILWQVGEWYNETIEESLLDEGSIVSLNKFFDSVETAFGKEEIGGILKSFTEQKSEKASLKNKIAHILAEGAKKIATKKVNSVQIEKRNNAIILLSIYNNSSLADRIEEKEVKDKFNALIAVMQSNITYVFDVLGGKSALVFTSFYSSMLLEFNQLKKLVEAGLYKSDNILEIDDSKLNCSNCNSDAKLKVEVENGLTIVKAICQNCGKVWHPNFSIAKGKDTLNEDQTQRVLDIYNNSFDKKLDELNDNSKWIRKELDINKDIVKEISDNVKKLMDTQKGINESSPADKKGQNIEVSKAEKPKKTDFEKALENLNVELPGDSKQLVSNLNERVEKNDIEAINVLAYCYFYGNGVRKNYANAIKLWTKASNKGISDAQFNLGNCYFKGIGVKKSFKKAIKLYKKAAENGNLDAQCFLGDCYFNGNGIRKSFKKAVLWWTKSAEQDCPEAQYHLGYCYYIGKGVKKNYETAVCWWTKSAEQNCADAQFYLALCYENGDGVMKNLSKALYWYTKSANQGYVNAQNSLKRLRG